MHSRRLRPAGRDNEERHPIRGRHGPNQMRDHRQPAASLSVVQRWRRTARCHVIGDGCGGCSYRGEGRDQNNTLGIQVSYLTRPSMIDPIIQS